MNNPIPTPQAGALIEALKKRGVEVEIEPWDGHKHVDLRIPGARMNVEINGLQHYTNPDQIVSDLMRSHYSDVNKLFTFPITNQLIDTYLDPIADAIKKIVEKRLI